MASPAAARTLTTGWGVNASYEHYWTPQWHESFYGGYAAVSYDSQGEHLSVLGGNGYSC